MTQQLAIPTLHPTVRVLSDEQARAIHYATLEILEKIGVEMQDPQGRDLLLGAGAWESNGRIKIPERLLIDALDTVPSRIPMYNRLGALAMPLEMGKVFFGSGSDTTFTLDLETGERRFATAADVETFARLADALDNIDFVMSMSNPSDVPPDDLYIHEFIGMVRGSVKPNVYTAKDRKDMEDIYRIAAAVAGSEQALREKPILLHYAEPVSPLLIIEESLQKHIFCAEKGIPAGFIPSTNTGGGGPITTAGAVALGSAESLVGLIISQLVNPGAPCLYGMNSTALDMRSTIVSYGAPEWSLSMAAVTDMARFYGLPVWGYAGASDSKAVDAQFGAEVTFSIMSAFLTRATLNHDVGYIGYGNVSSAEALVICDEIIDMTRFMVGGVEVSARTLALDAIADIRPGGGFLAAEHTLENWRQAQWQPSLIDRSRYERWEQDGRKAMHQRANERARRILAEHTPPPLPAAAEQVIAQVLEERAQAQH